MSSKTTNRRRAFGDVRNQRILHQSSANKQKSQQHRQTDSKQSQQASPISAKPTLSQQSFLPKQSTSSPVSKSEEKAAIVKDENDLTENIKDSYDPRLETYPMDDALYHKIAQLELADDGIPIFDSLNAEPFDF